MTTNSELKTHLRRLFRLWEKGFSNEIPMFWSPVKKVTSYFLEKHFFDLAQHIYTHFRWKVFHRLRSKGCSRVKVTGITRFCSDAVLFFCPTEQK